MEKSNPNSIIQHIEKQNRKMLYSPYKLYIEEFEEDVRNMYNLYVKDKLPIEYNEFRNFIIKEYN